MTINFDREYTLTACCTHYKYQEFLERKTEFRKLLENYPTILPPNGRARAP